MKKNLLIAGLSLLSVNMGFGSMLCHEYSEEELAPVVAFRNYLDEGSESSFMSCEGVDEDVRAEDRVLDLRTHYDLMVGAGEPQVCGYVRGEGEKAIFVVSTVDPETYKSVKEEFDVSRPGEYELLSGHNLRIRHVSNHDKDSLYGAVMTALNGESPCELPLVYMVEIY